MATLKLEEFEASLRTGKIGSLYLFDGPENLLKERALQKILIKLLPQEKKEFNFDRFDGRFCSGGEILSAARSLPWLNQRRVVLVESTEEIGASEAKIISEGLTTYPASTCLLFLYEGKSNLKDEIPAQVVSHGSLVTFWSPFPNKLPDWIMAEARQRGKGITREAALALSESGQSLQQQANELDKLILFVGARPTIDIKDVRSHGLPDEDGNFKDFEEAFYGRKLGKALKEAQLLNKVGVRPESVFSMMERMARMLYMGHHYWGEKKWPFQDICVALNIRGLTQQGNFKQGIKNYSVDEVRKLFRNIVEADYDLKIGALPPEISLSLLLLRVMKIDDGKSLWKRGEKSGPLERGVTN